MRPGEAAVTSPPKETDLFKEETRCAAATWVKISCSGGFCSLCSAWKRRCEWPGDDCAVVEARDRRDFLVLKTDCVVAGVHFLQTANALHIGWKAMMRPLSDFAATSAVPQFALITLIAPAQTKVEWVERIYRGLCRAAKRFQVRIVGGEMSSTPGPVAISVSVAGFVERDRCVSAPGAAAATVSRVGMSPAQARTTSGRWPISASLPAQVPDADARACSGRSPRPSGGSRATAACRRR